jgi:hypothetical protein
VSRRISLILLFAVSALLLVAAASGHPASRWGFVIAVLAYPVVLIGLGIARGGRAGGAAPRPRWPVWLVAVLVGGGGAWVLLASGRSQSGRLAGLPPATAVLVGVLGLVTLVAVVVAYGLTFDRLGVSAERLREIRRRRSGGSGGAG